jgi:flagellar motor switch protein FliM
MSSEILSQNDIDALLDQGRGKPTPGSKKPANRRDVALYDFRRPHRVSKERLRTLEAMYERLVKSLEGWMMGRVRGQIELSLQGVEQLSFSDFTLSLSTPCCSYVVEIRDSGGEQAVIDFGSEFAFFLVDRMLGGRGNGDAPKRALTPIERMVVRTVAERVTSLVREVWQDYIRLDLALAGFESVPEILRATSGDTPVLVASIAINAAGQESLVSICLPFTVLDSFFADAAAHRRTTVTGSEDEQRANRRVVEGSLRATHVDVAARLPEFNVSMKSLTSLKEGSMLATGLPKSTELQVLVGGVPRFSGKPARVGRKLAVALTDSLTESPLSDEAPFDLNSHDEEL